MTPTAKRYKQEAQEAFQAKQSLERRIKSMEEQKMKEEKAKSKNWNATVYCDNCLEVNAVSIPPTTTNQIVKDGDCVTCRIRGHLHLVRKVNNVLSIS